MNLLEERDDEACLFLQEMCEEEAAQRLEKPAEAMHKTVFLLPGETRFDIAALRKMVRHRNEMAQLLTEFLVLHPEDTALTRRARRMAGCSI